MIIIIIIIRMYYDYYYYYYYFFCYIFFFFFFFNRISVVEKRGGPDPLDPPSGSAPGSTFISNPSLLIITSRVEGELACYRPAACLVAHHAGVPGNCHLPARLSIRLPTRPRHQETALVRVS